MTFAQSLRRLIVGERLPTARAIHERLSKYLALPVFGSDPISSSAYATEEILLALMVAGAAGLHYSVAISVAIAALFAMVVISYRQTVEAYPSGGGAYIVARENLGALPGLLAAAALLTDYVLTVAVSVSAGTAAIVSAFPALEPERVLLCVIAIAGITLANLRGARESGALFAPPVYFFVLIAIAMIVVGGLRALLGNVTPVEPVEVLPASHPLTAFLLIRAFASGCAALTGIEAISNGVPAFRPPESRNAAITLLWMGGICLSLFVGITALSRAYHVVPIPDGSETVLSILGRSVFGNGALYLALQAATAGILILAANTAFADFPRLSSILARDGFAPRQLANLGDRLVFSNGIILLGAASSLLVVVFGGRTHALIPLYAVGVFVSFTLSQAGMVRHWATLRTRNWEAKATVNALGAAVTAIVFCVVLSVKFVHGAWIIVLVVPIFVFIFLRINHHYAALSKALRLVGVSPQPRALRHAVLVLVPGVHRGVLRAIRYAKAIAPESEAIYVEIDPKDTPGVKAAWARLEPGLPLTVLKSPWRSLTEPIIRYTRTVRAERKLDTVTVIIPEFVTNRWWHRLLHNQSGLMLKLALMFEPGVVVTNVRYHTGDAED